MDIAIGGTEFWLLHSLVLLAALECATIIVIGRRSLALAHEQTGLNATLDLLRERLDRETGRDRPFRDLVESDADPVVCRDCAGRIVFANRAFSALLGAPHGALVGTRHGLDPVEIGPAGLRADGSRLVEEAVEIGGERRWIAWAERRASGPDGSACTWRQGRDLTRRVASERHLEEARNGAEAASAAKSRFLASVSHEFRTPLNGIMGLSDLLLEAEPRPDQASQLRNIRGSAEAFLSLVEEILDFSAIEAGRLSLRSEPVDLVQLVEGVAELLAPRAQGQGLEIATCLAADCPRRVLADRGRLRQILLNLAGNAVKFTRHGGVGILVDRTESGAIRFSVEDTGPGIAAERQQAIFHDFEQGNGVTGGHEEGSGLGLAITRRLVAAMGGRLALDSEPGRGSIFSVELDLAPVTVPERRQLPQVHGKRVMVLAPDGIGTRLLLRRLREAGAPTSHAETVEAARGMLARDAVDVLVADFVLGDEAISEAASLGGAARRVLLLSPYEKRALGSAHAAGYDAYLTKPIRTRSLLQQIAPAPASRRPKVRPPLVEDAGRRFMRVLLAEDNDVNALIAVRALERIGATVDWARTGPEALAFATEAMAGQRPCYDVLLMDIRLPGLDGREVTRRIRQREAEEGVARRSHIVALSANVSAPERAAAFAAGIDDFLPKPFTPEMLRAALLPEAIAQAS